MTTIDVTVGGETVPVQIDERFVEMHEEVNDALDRELSIERFVAQALRNSMTAIEQSVERSIVDQYQAVKQAGDDEATLDALAEGLAFDGGEQDADD